MTRDAAWTKACESHACIEVVADEDHVLISTTEGASMVRATREEWEQFRDGVKAGKLDHL